jgi:hypothetical protein
MTKKKAKIIPERKYVLRADADTQTMIERYFLYEDKTQNRSHAIRLLLKAGHDVVFGVKPK